MRSFVFKFLVIFNLTLSLCLAGDFKPKFFAIENGVRFGGIENEVKTLKELGYDGVSQIKQDKNVLAKIEAYKKAGLKVLSIYLNVNDKALSKEIMKPFADQGGMIELTVRKMSDKTVTAIRETVEAAAQMNIKVALYPHHGFSIATIPQSLDLIKKVKHPNLGVIFNLCHFLKGEKVEDLESTLTNAAPYLFAVSTSGADEKGKSWGDFIKTLDQGNFSQKRFFKKLKELKFSGPVSLQCYAVKGDKKTNLQNSIQAWKEIIKDIQD